MSLFARLSNAGQGHALNKSDKEGTTPNSNSISSVPDIHRREEVAQVQLKTLKPGDIINYPKKGDYCSVTYEVCLEGTSDPFDSSTPFKFRLGHNQVIKGMDYAVSKMSLGQQIEAIIPYQHAYGVAGYPPIVPRRATLVFKIELLSFSSVV